MDTATGDVWPWPPKERILWVKIGYFVQGAKTLHFSILWNSNYGIMPDWKLRYYFTVMNKGSIFYTETRK